VLGDAVLAKIICGAWFEARDSSGNKRPCSLRCGVLMIAGRVLSQAQWTQLRDNSLSNDALARRAYQIGLDECVITADTKPAVPTKFGGYSS